MRRLVRVGRAGSGRWRRSGRRRRWCRSDRSFSAPVSSRKPSSLRDDLDLVGQGRPGPRWPTQCRKRVSAAPSRTWALRAPSISTAFLRRAAGCRGPCRGPPSAPAASRRSKYQAEDWAGSTSTFWPFSSSSAPRQVVGRLQASPALPSQAGSSWRRPWRGSRNSRAVPSAFEDRLAERQGRADDVAAADVEQPGDRGRRGQHGGVGARLGDAPRRCGRAWRLTSSPAYSAGCGTTGAAGCGGRSSPQAWSSGLASTGFSSAPGLGGGALQARQRVGAVQARVVADDLRRGRRRSPDRPARRPRPGRGSRTAPASTWSRTCRV